MGGHRCCDENSYDLIFVRAKAQVCRVQHISYIMTIFASVARCF